MTKTDRRRRKCLFHVTIPAMDLRLCSTDKECTNMTTRDLTVPYEGGFMTFYFCETHYMQMLAWSARKDKEGLN